MTRMTRYMDRCRDYSGAIITFSLRFKELRKDESLLDTVEKTGLSKQTICDIMAVRKKDIGMATVLSVADAYGVTPDYLFGITVENVAHRYICERLLEVFDDISEKIT